MIVLCILFAICAVNSAPVDNKADEATESSSLQSEEQIQGNGNLQDAPQTGNEKNKVQEWFEDVSKNASTNAQNAMNTVSDWFTKLAQASTNQNANIQQNLPTMYMGSFQLIKMPMPQMTDVIKGMGDLAALAQGFNKVTGGTLPIPQGIPLISQG